MLGALALALTDRIATRAEAASSFERRLRAATEWDGG
jgi:hypothetical protein